MTNIKDFYKAYSDKILSKRFNSSYPIRKYYHRKQYESILSYIKRGQNILDAGCGEGVLSMLMAEKGANVKACDISKPNIITAINESRKQNYIGRLEFIEADAENLPFEDNFFDVVVSSHVLEHLPSFKKGLAEIYRTTKDKAVIVLPTSLGLCGLVLLGKDDFWRVSRRSAFAVFIGLYLVIKNIFKEGVDENYANNKKLPHVRRHPWVAKREIKKAGFKIINYEASSFCLPYFNFLLPFVKKFDRYKNKPLLRCLGHGMIFLVKK